MDLENNLSKIGLEMSSITGYRKIFVDPENISFDSDTNVVSFGLPTGSYATMFLREWSHGGIVG